MAGKDKRPEIRFAGFADAWEQRKLLELGEVITGSTPSTQVQAYYSDDGIPWVTPTDILNNVTYRTAKHLSEEGQKVARVVPQNTVLVTCIASIGKNTMLGTTGSFNQQINGLVPNEKENYPYFLFAESTLWSEKMKRSAPAGTMQIVNKTDFSEFKTNVPNLAEQTRIGAFFNHLDKLITLQQRKYDKLVIVKKSLLEKMFPKDGANVPEVRFTGFTDVWEQWKVGDVLTEKHRPIKMEDDEEYQLITVKRRNEGVVSRGYFKGKNILVKNYFEIRTGDYLISKRQVIHGANGIVPESLDKSIVSNEYLVSIGNGKITTAYWTLISKLPNMYRQFFLSSYGVDIEKMVFDVEDWKKGTIIIPSLPEQERITLLFQRFDSLIALRQRELEKLKNIKKALLEKMFV